MPAGLVIAAVTGVISGTPSEAKATETTATVTVTDDAGNTTEEEVTFPVVSKGSQVLSGFSYSSSSVTYGADEPTVVAPTGAQTSVTYAATPEEVCTVEPDTGALTIVGLGNCVVTASAAGDANYEAAADVTFTVQVLSEGMLSVALETIADDDIVNAAEHGLGFAISGTVTTGGSVAVDGASVTVEVGATELMATTASDGTWSVNVGSDASYVVEPSVAVTVGATKTGHTDASEETRTLAVDLTPPSSRVYTVPSSLQVGVAMGSLSPSSTSDTDIASYGAAGLPAGLAIAAVTGVISGTPSEAKATETTATVTVTDTGGNTTEISVVFPVVSKGNQILSGFSYSSSSVTYGADEPTVVAPTGAQTSVTYAATPEEVCTVEPDTGALSIVGLGNCVVTASAAGDANYEAAAEVTFTVQVLSAGMLSVALETIADDDIVNAAEHGLGFAISGTVTAGGSQVSGASVTVRVGGTDLPAATTASDGTWSVDVGSDASYVVEPSVAVTVGATKTGHTDASEVTRTLAVDLTAPSSRVYTVPSSLQVGVAMGALSPSNTSDTDIASYGARDLPAGLVIAAATGEISGTPSEAKATETTATVTVTDTGGNTTEEEVTFPVVSKGSQVLSGFSYSSSSVTYGAGSPAVVAPTGAQTPVTYAATPTDVCTVNQDTGALTIVGLGNCVVTASAAGDANYEAAAEVTFTVQVLSAGMLSVALETIADDDIVNAAEHGLGFAISGTVTAGGSQVSGASVTVEVGATELMATTASDGTWSVNVGSDASYVVEPSVAVTVGATKSGHTDASEETRTLAVDLTPPSSRVYTVPSSLQVGVAMGSLSPSSTSDTDIASYDAAGLPAGLVIAAATGVISGTPSEAKATETTATVTVTDTGGNTTEISVVFPVVSKGNQILSGFSYVASGITFGDSAPTVVAPTGAQTPVTYAAAPVAVCTVEPDTGALSIVGLGNCVVRASAAGDANYEASAEVTFTVQVLSAGMLSVALETIADDDIVNAAEHGLGFAISGTVTTGGSVAVDGASVTVEVGGTDLPAATTASDGTWSVNVGSDASYVVEPSVAVTVGATKTGHTDASEVTRTLAVDLTAPSSRVYTVPSSLQVGVAMGALSPSNTSDTDIASYGAAGLPAGLVIAAATGEISGTPSEAKATETTATVTVTDTGGNTTEISVVFPEVSKGSQVLSGFSYSSSSVTYGAGSPAVVAPTGAQTPVTYAAAPVAVCTVEADTGALSIVGLGNCVVRASAAGDANYEAAAEVTFTVQVLSAGMLSVALETIADDDIVNAAEHGLGFAISGTVTAGGSVTVDGASVTVEVGATELMATTASDGTWSVNVVSDASYVVEPSVAVTVVATKTGHTDASEETRTLTVNLTVPSSPSYTVPVSLQVGVAMGALSPSSTSDTDIASYDARDLPAGLVIDSVTGEISGTPSEAKATETTATVTVTDTGGNTTEISVVFPEVSKGSQVLSGFSYVASGITFGDSAPTVVAPTGAQTPVTYAAAPVAVCTVEADTGALSIVGLGNCVVRASAAGDANYEASAEVTFTVQVLSAGMLSVALETIADDDIVNAAEHGLGFAISGTVTTGGSVAVDGASVTVEVGGTDLPAATTASDGTWSVNVGSDASYVVEPSVAVTVGATKTGHTDASEVTRTLAVDLTAPSSRVYTVPSSLQVGVAMGALSPSNTSDTDIASYGARDLPAGLVIAAATGEISGTPSEAKATETTATVTVTDTGGNTTEEEVTFPEVSKGNQILSGFSYSSSSVTYGADEPTVVAPTGAQTSVTYAATPEEVCTVNQDTGALSIVGLGNCVVRASAAGDANYEAADDVTFTVQVLSEGMLSVALETIADDDIVNAAEHGLGFVISGTVTTGGSVAVDGASVTVEVGATELMATTASDGTWSVNVGSDASYVVEPSVAVAVAATKTGHTDASEETRTLAVDLTAPSSPGYTVPSSLQVGVAMGALSPSNTSDTDTASYGAADLPVGLVIAAATGEISGTPSEAKATETTATVTVTDTGGNTTEEEVTFPEVSKGNQILSGFSYVASGITFGDSAPAVVAPTGAQTPVTYAAAPEEVCTVEPDTGALSIVGLGNCVVTASAAGDANYEASAEVTFTVQVLSTGMLSVALETIADDDIVNAAEHGLGFAISGTVTAGGSQVSGASVTVRVGGTDLPAATTASDGTWSVNVGSDASYVVEPSVTVAVGATKTGHTDASEMTRPLAVDLTAPSSRVYTVPSSLQVGVAMGALSPSNTSDTDIASYDERDLPAGLVIDAVTGEISGTPSEAKATETTATVTVTDDAGNTTEEEVTFPVVSKGSQVLSGFSYSSSSVTYGADEPTVVAPTGAQTSVTYAAAPEEVCTVEPDTGALTIVGLGNCVVTASAAGDANYEAADVTFTVQVLSEGMLSVALETIADDDIVNAAEHGLGFAISGTVTTGGSVAVDGASVTVRVGGTDLPAATTASDGTWSVNVGSDASYVVEPSVTVAVGATKTGHTDASEMTRPLAVDLTAPSSRVYTVPSSLQVGVAMGALSPSNTSDTDIASYDERDLPAGLVIDAVTGEISGTPSEAKATETTATVTVTDDAGNTTEEEVTFPVVSKGSQVLSGFSYSSSSVTYGADEPTVVAPTGAQTSVTYAATPEEVCTVEPDTGALTIVGLGNCVVTASAAGDANYEAAADVTFTVQVLSEGMLSVALETIADDDIVNAAEHGLGFAISGTVTTGGSVAVDGASVTVEVGATELMATTASDGTWSVNVGSDASYVVEPSVAVTVGATKTGHADASEVTRTLAVNLTAPSASHAMVTTAEDTLYTFSADDFGFEDTGGDVLASVTVVTPPAVGTLALGGAAVTAEQSVTKAQLDADTLTFTPVANAHGDDYTTFTFRVSDGADDSAAYTMTIDVTPGNDDATGQPAIGGTAHVGEVLSASPGSIDDIDGKTRADNGDAGYAYAYQWFRVDAGGTSNPTEIANAISATYTLTSDDVGRKVKVQVSFTDDDGTEETRTSEAYPASATVVGVPGEPQSFEAQARDTEVTLTWSVPASDGGSAVTGYRYRVSADGGATWNPDWTDVADGADADSDRANETTVTVTGLVNGTPYTFEVRAVNGVGGGAPAGPRTVTPNSATVPPAPTRPTLVSATNKTLTIEWTHPGDGSSPLIRSFVHYRVQGTAQWHNWWPGNTPVTRVTIRHLLANTTYQVRVHATNAVGSSPWSATASEFDTRAANRPATGAPTVTVTVTAAVGQTLTVDTAGIEDEDGKTLAEEGRSGYAYTYQWARVRGGSGTDIADATEATYEVVAQDAEHQLEVRVRFTDDGDNDETRTSARTEAVPDAGPPGLVSATLQGTALVLLYDEALDESSEPGTDAYAVTAVAGTDTTTPELSGVSVNGRKVTLTLAAAPAGDRDGDARLHGADRDGRHAGAGPLGQRCAGVHRPGGDAGHPAASGRRRGRVARGSRRDIPGRRVGDDLRRLLDGRGVGHGVSTARLRGGLGGQRGAVPRGALRAGHGTDMARRRELRRQREESARLRAHEVHEGAEGPVRAQRGRGGAVPPALAPAGDGGAGAERAGDARVGSGRDASGEAEVQREGEGGHHRRHAVGGGDARVGRHAPGDVQEHVGDRGAGVRLCHCRHRRHARRGAGDVGQSGDAGWSHRGRVDGARRGARSSGGEPHDAAAAARGCADGALREGAGAASGCGRPLQLRGALQRRARGVELSLDGGAAVPGEGGRGDGGAAPGGGEQPCVGGARGAVGGGGRGGGAGADGGLRRGACGVHGRR